MNLSLYSLFKRATGKPVVPARTSFADEVVAKILEQVRE